MNDKFVLAVHGGTGSLAPETLTPAAERALHAGLRRALIAGYTILDKGGSAAEAVVTAVMEFEDDHWFNAGVGSVFNTMGHQEMDAGVMDGRTMRIGAVFDVCGPRNPVQAARRILERHGPEKILTSGAVIEFCRQSGIPLEDESYFQTERRWRELQSRLRGANPCGTMVADRAERHGTVGAVALDRTGGLAAAVSACGVSAYLSAGGDNGSGLASAAWADPDRALAATGDGEHFLRPRLVNGILARLRTGTTSLAEAASQAVAEIGARGGSGGLIGIDAAGRVTMPFNTRGMCRGVARDAEQIKTAIFRENPQTTAPVSKLAPAHAHAA